MRSNNTNTVFCMSIACEFTSVQWLLGRRILFDVQHRVKEQILILCARNEQDEDEKIAQHQTRSVCVCVSLMHAQICQAITNTRLIYEWLFCAYSLIVARRCSFIFIGHELRGSFFLTLLQYGHIYLLPLSQCITLFVYLLCIYGNAFIISTIVLCERREPFAWIFFQLNCDCRWLWLHLMPVQMNLQA